MKSISTYSIVLVAAGTYAADASMASHSLNALGARQGNSLSVSIDDPRAGGGDDIDGSIVDESSLSPVDSIDGDSLLSIESSSGDDNTDCNCDDDDDDDKELLSCGPDSDLRMASDYNCNSQVQLLGATILTPFIRRAAMQVSASLPKGKTFKVCEYGCATGGSSILPLTTIQDTIGDRPLDVNMVDLPMNDWDVLKSTVETKLPTINFSYVSKSMYLPICNDEEVHLAYSCYAQQWLSDGAPTGLPDGAIWANQLPRHSKQRKASEEASKRDWDNFLSLRSKEVVPGGIMVFLIQGSMSSCGSLSEGFAATMQEAKKEMIAAGELSETQAQTMVVPEYGKSPMEILAQLSCSKNQCLWSVEELQHSIHPCGFVEEWRVRSHKDPITAPLVADEIIKKQILFLRAFTDASLLKSLDQETLELYWLHVQRLADGNPE
eukprot:CAMPEP_0168262440 /NCGR_PEP_ID=MMETSP0141_2-20121125/9716_1 /TAXON_ID=44445 /ORGANISM="Pseudo-nitzschia australis, Strain 10249 10 AB" /LENGTH=435 /DNA_ID=CAMNT_0008200861 /DNA_START=107 /DNA_END=1411 /DNA_ORIENTATION=-